MIARLRPGRLPATALPTLPNVPIAFGPDVHAPAIVTLNPDAVKAPAGLSCANIALVAWILVLSNLGTMAIARSPGMRPIRSSAALPTPPALPRICKLQQDRFGYSAAAVDSLYI